jgi:streptogramin lyase
VWFTDGGLIGRITITGTITINPLDPNADFAALTAGPNGNLWFTDAPSVVRLSRLETTPAQAKS